MKLLLSAQVALATLISFSALAIMPKASPVYNDQSISDRACVLEFTNEPGQSEILSGVLINSQRIVTVGHALFFNRDLDIKCGFNGKKLIRPARRVRHPRWDYKDNPKSVQDWAKYDIAVIDIKTAAVSVQPLPVISDINEVRSLLQQERCIYGGAGENMGKSIRDLNVVFIKTPKTPGVVSETHATVKYPGEAEVMPGDSGGPLLCQRADNLWYLAGLLDYGGTSRNNVTGKIENIVAILVLRPELLNEFVYTAK